MKYMCFCRLIHCFMKSVISTRPKQYNPNLTPIGDGFGFVYYFQYPNFNSKINKYIVYEI